MASAFSWHALLVVVLIAPTLTDAVCSLGLFGNTCQMGVGEWYVGCFSDSTPVHDLPVPVTITNLSLLTPQWCTSSCGRLGYMYAGLQFGAMCYCGGNYGSFGTAAASRCRSVVCPGDANQYCGGSLANAVFRTAFYLAPPVVTLGAPGPVRAYSSLSLSAVSGTDGPAPDYYWDIDGTQYTGDVITHFFGSGSTVSVMVTASNPVMNVSSSLSIPVLSPVSATFSSAFVIPSNTTLDLPLTLNTGSSVSVVARRSNGQTAAAINLPDPVTSRLGIDLLTPSSSRLSSGVLLLAGFSSANAGMLEAVEVELSAAGSVTFHIYRPVCANGSRYCRWTASCTAPDSCVPSVATCISSQSFCPTTVSCVDSTSTCPTELPAVSPTWTQAALVTSFTLAFSSSGFQYGRLSTPLSVETGDVLGVTVSNILVWGSSTDNVYGRFTGSNNSTFPLTSITSSVRTAAYVVSPTYAQLSINSSGVSQENVTVSVLNTINNVSKVVSITYVPILQSGNIRCTVDRVFGQKSVLLLMLLAVMCHCSHFLGLRLGRVSFQINQVPTFLI